MIQNLTNGFSSTVITPTTPVIVSGARPGFRSAQVGESAKSSVPPEERALSSSNGSVQKLDDLVLQVQKTLSEVGPNIQLSIDKETEQVLVRVVDSESGDLIRQIPPEEQVKLQKFLREQSGLLVETKA